MFVTNARLYTFLKSIIIKIPFLGTFLKYIKQKVLFIIHISIKKLKQYQYRNAPFSDINFMIDTSVNEKQYEYVDHNTWYQHGLAIKTYAGFKNTYKLPVSIEHGIKLPIDDKNQENHYHLRNDLPVFFVPSETSKEFYSKYTDKEIIAIGPCIHYAQPLLDEKLFKKEKKRLGKSLLIMPTHSGIFERVVYTSDEYLNKYIKIAKDFDTVRVCLHWYDVENKLYDQYIKQGWECVCAGHETNNLFMSRLKSIITLSDFVVSDDFGDQVGYSTYLRKPFLLIRQDYDVKLDYKAIEKCNSIGITAEYAERFNKEFKKSEIRNEFFDKFSSYNSKVTTDQLELAGKYWGFNCIKSKNNMREIILQAEDKLKSL